jgi:endoglucanase
MGLVFRGDAVKLVSYIGVMVMLLAEWVAVAGAAGGDVPAPAAGALLSNGNLAREEGGWPADWPRTPGVTYAREAGQAFLRFQSPKPGEMVLLYRQAELPKVTPAALEIRLRVRHKGIEVGKESWFDGRVMLKFRDRDGRDVSPEPGQPSFRGTSEGWVDRSLFVKVPKGATLLAVMPCLFQVKAGQMDLAALEVFPARADQLPPEPVAKGAMIYSTPMALPEAKLLPPELHVAGHQLQTKDGQMIWLQGVCIDSYQWSDVGENVLKSIPVAVRDWKSNVIRLPVTEDFWFGRTQHQNDGGVSYRKRIDAAIEAAAAQKAYVALDLHRYAAPMPEHLEFWKDAATRYKNHPGVLFELFNEPHDISWKVWRDGGRIKDEPKREGVIAENAQKVAGDTTPGMQAMVDVVRATGARNIIIAGGLDWSYDLSGILNGYALNDRAGDGIMYSAHVYPWKSDWRKNFILAAEKYPIFIGEVGCIRAWEDFDFIPKESRKEKLGPECTWSQDMLGVIQKYKLNWTAFSFHPTCGPNAIMDWNYTPSPFWGVFAKEALNGKQFETTRMR